jgi:dCTP deaminase
VELDIATPTVFERGCVYIVPLMEHMNLPSDIGAKANPKSTAGRLDIFTRLITDGAIEFEQVPNSYKGGLYAEIVPRTFPILLTQGDRLNQLRFSRGKPPSLDSRLQKLDEEEILVYEAGDRPGEASIRNGLRLSINLQGTSEDEVVGYRAKKHAPAIEFTKINRYTPTDFWEIIQNPKNNSLILNPDDFYILGSKEKIRVPPHYAAEMVAYDSSIGEFRIHYAGFFDPGFGYGLSDVKGTHAVLEVRSHDVPFIIEDGQTVGRLIYERLMAPSEKIYGVNIGSSYQCQGLSLSKQFRRN